MLRKFFNKILAKDVVFPLLLFLLAFGARLAFLLLNDPQSPGQNWYGDVYHHWQVAYLTKTVGFKHGFLRLWDLKGMEFFWGLMHPLVLVVLFALTGSVSIIIPRLLSVFCGSVVVVFIYLLLKRSFNRGIAFVVGIWAALFSVVLFSDTLGMQEQLGLLFLFAGLLAWPKKGFLSGLFWAFASMARSEYWLFALGLVLAALFDRKKKTSNAKAALFFTYLILIGLYMKYLLNYTGNAIFPIYWNYLASVVGEWFTNTEGPLNSVQITAQWFGRGLFVLGVVGAIMAFIKRRKEYLFFLLGFFNVAFIGFIFGFAAYIHGFFDRFWVDRLLAFPYLFLGILVILFFLNWLPNRFPRGKVPLLVFGSLIFLAILAGSQLAWEKIFYYFRIAQKPYEAELMAADFIAKNDPGGRILFPAGRSTLTYALVYNHHFSGERFLSNMYDPFYYAEEGQTSQEIEEKTIDWLEREEVKLIVYSGKSEYRNLFKVYSRRFKKLDSAGSITLYEFLR